jgi:hypothetical protein
MTKIEKEKANGSQNKYCKQSTDCKSRKIYKIAGIPHALHRVKMSAPL